MTRYMEAPPGNGDVWIRLSEKDEARLRLPHVATYIRLHFYDGKAPRILDLGTGDVTGMGTTTQDDIERWSEIEDARREDWLRDRDEDES